MINIPHSEAKHTQITATVAVDVCMSQRPVTREKGADVPESSDAALIRILRTQGLTENDIRELGLFDSDLDQCVASNSQPTEGPLGERWM